MAATLPQAFSLAPHDTLFSLDLPSPPQGPATRGRSAAPANAAPANAQGGPRAGPADGEHEPGLSSGAGGSSYGRPDAAAKDSDDGSSSNPLKRRHADADGVDYPRRRATIACEVCRSRKSRCDGTKPKCKLCAELGADCVYREPGIKLDAGDKLILEQLNRIEGLLQVGLGPSGLLYQQQQQQIQMQQQQQSQLSQQHQQQQQQHQHHQQSLLQHSPASSSMVTGGLWTEQQAAAAAAAQAAAEAEAAVLAAAQYVSVIPAGGIGTWTSVSVGQNNTTSLGHNTTSLGHNNLEHATTTTNISTMPRVHTNAALHLLQWPRIRDLVGRPYDPQSLLQLEMARAPLHALAKTPCVDLANTAAYSAAFFARVNVWYACVSPYTWRAHYRAALSHGFREGAESCVVLLVLALGQASLGGSISRLPPSGEVDPPGLPYFTAAWALLPGMMTANTVVAAQCHLLAAAYLFYLVRPLEAWNLLCTTSTKLQLLLMAPGRVPPAQRELVERIYWNTLLFESDLLAELDLPHSGVVQFEENVGLPCGFEGGDEGGVDEAGDPAGTGTVGGRAVDADPDVQSVGSSDGGSTDRSQGGRRHSLHHSHRPPAVGRDDLWYFLAEIALRRLLNRVSQLLYSRESLASTASLAPVVAELDYQLTQWYESLPRPLQFSFEASSGPAADAAAAASADPAAAAAAADPDADPVRTVLRLRFFACRTIIYRPYILAVLDHEPAVLDPAVRAACHTCLEASVRQIEHVTAHHAGHMPYLWQGALSIVSQTLLVMGASLSPALAAILRAIVPRRAALDRIFADVVAEIGRYAALAPSLRLAAEIVREAEERRRAMLGG